jgi:hypothetical protein
MAADAPHSLEKLEEGLSSPSTADTDDLGGSTVHDCKAVIGDSASERRSRGLLALPSYWSRTCSLSEIWRHRLRIRKPDRVPDIEETKTRKREKSPAIYGTCPGIYAADFI